LQRAQAKQFNHEWAQMRIDKNPNKTNFGSYVGRAAARPCRQAWFTAGYWATIIFFLFD
jgi:hypothetical protein